jgi:hypothetical protein
MNARHNPKLRFGISPHDAIAARFQPGLTNAPPLPTVNYALLGKTAPTLPTTPTRLPQAQTVVITWADAEWAALQHVFCGGASTMPYSSRTKGSWPGWVKYVENLPSGAASGWDFWGEYRLVELTGTPVLLWKSNTHLDFPGASYLTQMIQLLVQQVQPKLILSTGTAGGARPGDHIGTVRAVSAGTLYQSAKPPAQWPDYSNNWTANGQTLNNPDFTRLLFPIPITATALQTLSTEFNRNFNTSYSLAELDPNGLNLGDPTPQINDETGGAPSLLTTTTFVVGTTAGTHQNYTAIEMDDAVIGEACKTSGTEFGFIRNISDPVQNASLPAKVQGNWGSAVYDAVGFYTSFNSALTTWAMLA